MTDNQFSILEGLLTELIMETQKMRKDLKDNTVPNEFHNRILKEQDAQRIDNLEQEIGRQLYEQILELTNEGFTIYFKPDFLITDTIRVGIGNGGSYVERKINRALLRDQALALFESLVNELKV